MNLEELITALEATDPNRIVARGFSNPHSYRGDYMDLAFEPATDIRVGEMLDAARSALGATFQGWKGGEFTMSEHTWCWLSQEGDASGETISALLVELLLAPAAVSVVPPATNQTALRERVAEALLTTRRTDYEGAARHGEHRYDARCALCAGDVDALADAVLAVLPAPVDRAAVLQEAADWLWAQANRLTERGQGVLWAAERLRRWAAEQPAVGSCVAAETPQPVTPVGGVKSNPFDYHPEDDQPTAEAPHTETPDAEGLPARLEAVLTERFTELGNPFSEMRRHEQGPDGWPSSHPVGPHQVAEVLRELLTATAPAVVAQPGKETDTGAQHGGEQPR